MNPFTLFVFFPRPFTLIPSSLVLFYWTVCDAEERMVIGGGCRLEEDRNAK